MVTGSNSKSSRGHTRYYHCGTYQRKGSNACKRNGVSKEKIETAVLNSLIREFSLLSYQGSLEDEIRRHIDYQNREITFQLALIEDEINHLNRRITLAKAETKSGEAGKYLSQYISELKDEIKKQDQQRQEINNQKTSLQITPDHLTLIRDKLRDFVSRIKIEPPDQQHRLLQKYVTTIVADQFTAGYKLIYQVPLPNEIGDKRLTIIEKTLYFSLDLQ